MIKSNTRLFVFHDDNGSFVSRTADSADYIRDNYDVTMVAAEDYMYMGFTKNFGSVYYELPVPNINANTFTAEYWDGTAWQTIELVDETQGWTRSGFMYWDKSVMASTTVNTIEGFYIRIRPDVDHTQTTVRAANLVFSDDAALKAEFFDIDRSELLPPGETSHISVHVAARNKIIQLLRNRGYRTETSLNVLKDLDQWDMIDIFQVREAATHLALSKIFFNLFDNPEDHWYLKYLDYQKRFESAMELAYLSIDDNNDGVDASAEKGKQFKSQRWAR